MIFISPFSGRLIARFGARRLMTAGMACGVVGLLVLTRIGRLQLLRPAARRLPAVRHRPRPRLRADVDRGDGGDAGEKVGIASGVLAMDRVMAGTIALAATGAVFHALLGGGDSFAASVAGSTWVSVDIKETLEPQGTLHVRSDLMC